MRKHKKSILALLLVISLLAASLCAVPVYAAKPDRIESADLERTPIEYVTLFAVLNYGSGYLRGFPGEGLTIMNDAEAASILERINGEGELSYGRVGDEHDIDLEKYSLAYLNKHYYWDGGYGEEVLEISMTEDGDIAIVTNRLGASVVEDDSESSAYIIIALKKTDVECLNESSVLYLGSGVSPTSIFRKAKLELSIDGADRFNCEPKIPVGFEILYEKYDISKEYFDEHFKPYFSVWHLRSLEIFNTTVSKELLEKINGDGEFSDGRIGGDHKINLETHYLAILTSRVDPNVYRSFSADISRMSISHDGNLFVVVKSDYDYYKQAISSINEKHYVIIFAVEKEKIDSLNEESRLFVEGPIVKGSTWWQYFQIPPKEEIVLPPHDVNADGVFDAKDLTRLMQNIAGDSAATVAQSADINGDGAIDTKDLTRMMKLLAAG